MRIGIVGAGTTGLACGYYLSKAGHDLHIFEENERCGGLARNFELTAGNNTEVYGHIFSSACKSLFELLDELELKSEISRKNIKIGAFSNSVIRPFGNLIDLIRFPALSHKNKIKFLALLGRIMLIKNWESLDTISAKEWIIRHAGIKTYESIFQNFFESKFNGLAHAVPMAWFWAEIKEVSKSSGLLGFNRKAVFFPNSTEALFKQLTKAIELNGGTIYTGSPVTGIKISSGGAKSLIAGNKEFQFDKIILTIPIPRIKAICKELFYSFPEKIRQIEYSSITNLILTLKRPFSGYAVINILDPQIPFPKIIELTNIKPARLFNNNTAISIPCYARVTSEILKRGKTQLAEFYTPYLKMINKNFSESEIIGSRLFSEPNAEPYYFLNYSSAIPDFQSKIKDLYIANTCQIYPEPRTINSTIKQAKEISQIITEK